MKKYLLALCAALFSGCASLPKGAQPVTGFDLNRYLGVWHEVARLDHSFERGLTNVTAEYSLRPDGGVKVLNRGFSTAANKWKQAAGRAYFMAAPEPVSWRELAQTAARIMGRKPPVVVRIPYAAAYAVALPRFFLPRFLSIQNTREKWCEGKTTR